MRTPHPTGARLELRPEPRNADVCNDSETTRGKAFMAGAPVTVWRFATRTGGRGYSMIQRRAFHFKAWQCAGCGLSHGDAEVEGGVEGGLDAAEGFGGAGAPDSEKFRGGLLVPPGLRGGRTRTWYSAISGKAAQDGVHGAREDVNSTENQHVCRARGCHPPGALPGSISFFPSREFMRASGKNRRRRDMPQLIVRASRGKDRRETQATSWTPTGVSDRGGASAHPPRFAAWKCRKERVVQGGPARNPQRRHRRGFRARSTVGTAD